MFPNSGVAMYTTCTLCTVLNSCLFMFQTDVMIFSGLNNDLLARDGLVALDMKVS